MKKNFLLAMVVMLMTAVSSFAQKEYNMVITLSNGTTVTLGHNDIKEITFNDGEVAISGNMVNTIDSLAQVTCVLNDYNSKQDQTIQNLADVTVDGFNQLGTMVDTKLTNLATAVDENFALHGQDISALKDFMENQNEVNINFQNTFEAIINVMEKLHPELAESKKFKAAKAAVAAARKK